MELTGNENEMIRKVSIYFLLMAYSGMRFGDAMKFDPAIHIVDDERIVMDYHKFDTSVNNKMYNRLRVIVELVKLNPLNTSNKTFNQWLKVIAATCNIKINLSAHVGRHTMGGLLAEMEIPEEQARIILGQRDIRSTRIYYHIKNKNIDKAMDTMNTLS
jgi:site-specific recombinase XerD